jgi:hypothetical protein
MTQLQKETVTRGTLGLCKCDSPSAPSKKYCAPCHAAYMREWRKTHPMSEAQRRRSITRAYSRVLVMRGHLIPVPCACGSVDVERHHDDYGDPRKVTWVCRPCHLAHHRGALSLSVAPNIDKIVE